MRIKNTALVVFSCLFSLVTVSTQARQPLQGLGRLNVQGSIVDTACSIAVESREQTIDMGVTPIAEIARDGQGNRRAFVIKLVNCVLTRPGKEGSKHFQVTFAGDAEGALFGIQGEASGIALQITDVHGNVAIPGQAMPLSTIVPGEHQMNYTFKLMSNRHFFKAGDYFSSIRFKLDYF